MTNLKYTKKDGSFSMFLPQGETPTPRETIRNDVMNSNPSGKTHKNIFFSGLITKSVGDVSWLKTKKYRYLFIKRINGRKIINQFGLRGGGGLRALVIRPQYKKIYVSSLSHPPDPRYPTRRQRWTLSKPSCRLQKSQGWEHKSPRP